MTTTKMYAIRDKRTKELWASPKGKRLWHRKGDAKNAWNVQQPYDFSRAGTDQPKFDTEDHGLEVVEYSLIPTKELESLKKDSDWLADLESAGVDNWVGFEHAHELRRERTGEEY